MLFVPTSFNTSGEANTRGSSIRSPYWFPHFLVGGSDSAHRKLEAKINAKVKCLMIDPFFFVKIVNLFDVLEYIDQGRPGGKATLICAAFFTYFENAVFDNFGVDFYTFDVGFDFIDIMVSQIASHFI